MAGTACQDGSEARAKARPSSDRFSPPPGRSSQMEAQAEHASSPPRRAEEAIEVTHASRSTRRAGLMLATSWRGVRALVFALRAERIALLHSSSIGRSVWAFPNLRWLRTRMSWKWASVPRTTSGGAPGTRQTSPYRSVIARTKSQAFPALRKADSAAGSDGPGMSRGAARIVADTGGMVHSARFHP